MIHKKGNPYGVHRVLEPEGVLPQPATKINNLIWKFTTMRYL